MPEAKTMMLPSSSDDSARHYDIKILNLFDPELQLTNTKSVLKNNLKDLLGELKKFKVQSMLVAEYKKTDYHKPMHKIFHLCAKLIIK